MMSQKRRCITLELWAIWFIIAAILLIAEMLTLTFYLLWLGIGAAAAGTVALAIPGSFAAQGLAGGAAALLLTVFTKRITRGMLKARGFRDPVDELVGKQGLVVESISAETPGIVKVGGDSWSAVSAQPLNKGESVKIVSRGTATLEVKKWED